MSNVRTNQSTNITTDVADLIHGRDVSIGDNIEGDVLGENLLDIVVNQLDLVNDVGVIHTCERKVINVDLVSDLVNPGIDNLIIDIEGIIFLNEG